MAMKVRRRRVRRKPAAPRPACGKVNRKGRSALMVGGARDPAEAAADRMARAVLTGTHVAAPSPASAPAAIHRKCAGCAAADSADPEKEGSDLRMSAAASGPAVASGTSAAAAPSSAVNAVSALGHGRALARAERAFFEPRFGRDLSAVRIHEDAGADRAAASLGARAFAHGTDIAFAGGRHAAADRALMAHELAHVVQGGTATRRAPVIRRACRDCASSPDPDLNVKITPVFRIGTPTVSPFAETQLGTYRTRQVSVWQREVRTCDTCETPRGTKPVWEVCPRKIKVLGSVNVVINPNEIARTDGPRRWWTQCSNPHLGRDRFLSATDAAATFTDPKRKTTDGVRHHERHHVALREQLLRDRIAARTDLLRQCPYDAEAIATWKANLEQTLRTDADGHIPTIGMQAGEEAAATRTECSRY